MRKTFALAAIAAAAVSLAPATSASAQCIVVEPLPGCVNVCRIIQPYVPIPWYCTL